MLSKVELREFFVGGEYSEAQHILLHIAEPEDLQEKEKGYFFAIAEIKDANAQIIEKTQDLINDIELLYYKTDEGTYKENFEKTLKQMNNKEDYAELREAHLHLFVGLTRGSGLSFAYRGKPHILLFYESQNTLRHKYLVEEANNSKDLFPNVVEGHLGDNNYFYVSSPNINKIFSNDRIQKLLMSRSLEQTTEHIQKVLESMDAEECFGGIFCQTKADHKEVFKTQDKTGSEESINNLLNNEKKANETITPSIFSGGLTTVKSIFSPPKIQEGKDDLKGPIIVRQKEDSGFYALNTILITFGKALVITFLAVFRITKYLFIFIYKLISSIILFIFSSSKRKEMKENLKSSIAHKKMYFQEISLFHKIVIVLIFLLGMVFMSSVSYLHVQAAKENERQLYVAQIQEIINKQIEAESNIIYKNEQQAYNLLKEAEEILKELPDKTKEQADKKAELINELDLVYRKLRKIEVVNPDIFFETQNVKINKIELLEDLLVLYGKDTKKIHKVNINTKQVSEQEYNNALDLTKSTVPKENDKIVFLGTQNDIIEYEQKNSSISKKEIVYPKNDPDIASVFIYSQKLYTIDRSNNQIYKHDQTQTGYEKGTIWLKQATDLSNSIDLAIDSNLYVLKNNGELLKFNKGIQEEFSISMVEPKMQFPSEMWTYADTEEIYILEPVQKRVVIIDKQGKLIKQYTSLKWQNPESMAVDLDNKNLFVLDSNKIYKIDL